VPCDVVPADSNRGEDCDTQRKACQCARLCRFVVQSAKKTVNGDTIFEHLKSIRLSRFVVKQEETRNIKKNISKSWFWVGEEQGRLVPPL
jgi:hypothetical protein